VTAASRCGRAMAKKAPRRATSSAKVPAFAMTPSASMRTRSVASAALTECVQSTMVRGISRLSARRTSRICSCVCLRVRAGHLVEQEEARAAAERSRQPEPRQLSTGKADGGSAPDHRVVALPQHLDDMSGTVEARGAAHVLVRVSPAAESDVVPHGTVQHVEALGQNAVCILVCRHPSTVTAPVLLLRTATPSSLFARPSGLSSVVSPLPLPPHSATSSPLLTSHDTPLPPHSATSSPLLTSHDTPLSVGAVDEFLDEHTRALLVVVAFDAVNVGRGVAFVVAAARALADAPASARATLLLPPAGPRPDLPTSLNTVCRAYMRKATVSISALSKGMRHRCHASGSIVIDVACSAKHTQSCTKKSSNTNFWAMAIQCGE
jgi:hypothetical protein